MLEPCDGKLSSTVLRGLGADNSPLLPSAARAIEVPLTMTVLTGNLRFDLSATMIYLQLMTSLEDSEAGIQNPEVR